MNRSFRVCGIAIIVSLLGCGVKDDETVTRCRPSRLFMGEREGALGKVQATASCWINGCPIQPWAPGAEGEIEFQMIDNAAGVLSVQSSDPAVLLVEELPADEDDSCVPPLEVKVTSLALGDADIIVLRDGEPYDRLPITVRQPASIELYAGDGTRSTLSDRLCATEGSLAVLLPALFDQDGTKIGYATPGWAWEIDGQPAAGNLPFQQARTPRGAMQVTVRWGEISDAMAVEGFPTQTLADPGFRCGE